MTRFERETYESLNSSNSSLDVDDLTSFKEEERKLSGVVRGVYVSYGMRSLMIRQDLDESFSEVKRAVEKKTGIPMDEQVLAWENSGVEVKDDKSLRNYGYFGGAFCKLSKA